MVYSYGARVDNNSNAITVIDEENETAVTTGYVNGEYVEFSGGGSSDFSTATVTIVNNTGSELLNCLYDFIIDGEEWSGISTNNNIGTGTHVFTVPLYKGVNLFSLPNDVTIEISGDAENDDGDITVTGDCTITLS